MTINDKPITATEINNRSAEYARKYIEPLQRAILQPLIDRTRELLKEKEHRNRLTTKAAHETDFNEYCKLMREIEICP